MKNKKNEKNKFLRRKLRKSRKNYDSSEHIDLVNKNYQIEELISVDGYFVTFKTRAGNKYRMDMQKAVCMYKEAYVRRILDPEIFSTIRVEGNSFHFEPNMGWNLEFCGHLMQKVSE